VCFPVWQYEPYLISSFWGFYSFTAFHMHNYIYTSLFFFPQTICEGSGIFPFESNNDTNKVI
jgi:hypothetical protein